MLELVYHSVFDQYYFSYVFTGETTLQNNYIVFDGYHFSYAATKQGKKSSYSKFLKEETFLKNSQWEKTFPNLVSTEAFQLYLY